MGGMKRKIPMEKIENKDSRAVAFTKRRNGLYSKTSELCLLSGANIAILATPVSSNSNASFYSFGHSSVDSVVSAFLANQPPREDLGLGFWWKDKSLLQSENPDELRHALDSMSRLMNKLKEVRLDAMKNREDLEDLKKKDVFLHGTHQMLDQNQTLKFESTTSASPCIQDDLPAKFEGFVKNTEEEHILASSDKNKYNNDLDDDNIHLSDSDEDQILAISDNSNNNALPGDLGGCDQELDLDQIFDFETEPESLSMNDASMATTNQTPCSSYGSAEDVAALVMHRDLDDDNFHFSYLDEDQILGISDNINNGYSTNMDWCYKEFDLEEIFDFETKNEGLSMNLKIDDAPTKTTTQNPCSDSDTDEDGNLVCHRDLDEDNLHFSDFFDGLSSFTELRKSP